MLLPDVGVIDRAPGFLAHNSDGGILDCLQ